MEEELPKASDHQDNSATSDTLIGTDGFNHEEVQSTDSDSDDDYDIAKKCFERAKKHFSSDQHVKALDFFRAGLKRAEKLGLKKKARLELRTIQMQMGLSLLSLGELAKSERCLLSLAWPQTTDDKSKILALHASSGLAQICLCKGCFDEAENWCDKSRIGWKRMAGKEHPAYITCLRLSAFSSELNGNHAEAAAMEEIANESKAAPAPVDTGLDAYESLGFTIEKSRTLITEHHKKVPDITKKEASTKTRQPSPAEQPGSGPINGPPAQMLAESPIKSKSGATPGGSLHDAARKGDTGLIKRLLENGANIEGVAGTELERPLYLAAVHGKTSAVEYLLDRGANIEAKAKYGETALSKAALYGKTLAVEYLLDRGANIEAKANYGETALSKAASLGQKSTVECLLDRGANIEAKDNYSETALSKAASGGDKSTVECLLDRGANIEAKNTRGQTPLLYKCYVIVLLQDKDIDQNQSENLQIIELLCLKGADVSVKDNTGKTPLKYAKEVKDGKIQRELISVLKKYGAKE